MRKVFRMEELDCAHCAQKMEDGIRKIKGVKDAKVNFLLMKLTVEAEDAVFESVMDEAEKICRRIEPDCRIIR